MTVEQMRALCREAFSHGPTGLGVPAILEDDLSVKEPESSRTLTCPPWREPLPSETRQS
jgi:hypothetical protein